MSSQTPTFNAAAVVDATLAAIRKGKEITLFVDLGFNDGVSVSRYDAAIAAVDLGTLLGRGSSIPGRHE
jgi:hypothetical protein